MVKPALSELSKALGGAAILDAEAAAGRYGRDFAGHDLGRAAGAVLPRSTEEVAAVVAWARRRGVALTPVGAQTSFWANTKADGRLVVDLRGMQRLLGVDKVNLTVSAEAGMSVAALHAALSAQGLYLPVSPDGFGDATLGSMIGNETSAGHGMFDGPIGDHVVSLTAVLGTGAVARTGASSVLAGLPAFSRSGLPDATGLLLASEGALGIVTELTLRVRPAPLRLTLEASGGGAAVLAAAQRLRHGGLCEALRHDRFAVSGRERVLVQVAAYGGPEDLASRGAVVGELLRQCGLRSAPAAEEPRWMPRLPVEGWKGVSLAVPYSSVEAVSRLWDERLRARVAGLARPEGFLRLYYGSAGAAVLAAWSHEKGPEEAHRDLACEIRALLLPFGVPYRIGTVWRPLIAGRVDPAYRNFMGEIKRLCDPDGVLNPGVSVFPAPSPQAPRRPAARRRTSKKPR